MIKKKCVQVFTFSSTVSVKLKKMNIKIIRINKYGSHINTIVNIQFIEITL